MRLLIPETRSAGRPLFWYSTVHSPDPPTRRATAPRRTCRGPCGQVTRREAGEQGPCRPGRQRLGEGAPHSPYQPPGADHSSNKYLKYLNNYASAGGRPREQEVLRGAVCSGLRTSASACTLACP